MQKLHSDNLKFALLPLSRVYMEMCCCFAIYKTALLAARIPPLSVAVIYVMHLINCTERAAIFAANAALLSEISCVLEQNLVYIVPQAQSDHFWGRR